MAELMAMGFRSTPVTMIDGSPIAGFKPNLFSEALGLGVRFLEVPEDISVVATLAVGYPAKPFPERLRRREIAEFAFAERYGEPL